MPALMLFLCGCCGRMLVRLLRLRGGAGLWVPAAAGRGWQVAADGGPFRPHDGLYEPMVERSKLVAEERWVQLAEMIWKNRAEKRVREEVDASLEKDELIMVCSEERGGEAERLEESAAVGDDGTRPMT